MEKFYPKQPVLPLLIFLIVLFAASCKKDPKVSPTTPTVVTSTTPTNFAKLGLYEQISGNSRRIFIALSRLGDVITKNYGLVFDTGSTGLTVDATDIIPASMIGANGFIFTGDSVTVNGITITSQQSTLSYGGVDGAIKEYGNLAYAVATIGDGNGNVSTPRIPIFLYYKVVNTTTGVQLSAHAADVFGVGSGYSSSSKKIASPLSYFKLGTDVTNGFRLALLNATNFTSTTPTYTAGLLTIGLTPDDLNSSGFIMHPLTYNALTDYLPNINSTIVYNGKSLTGPVLLDTGTPVTTIISDATATANSAALPANSTVSMATGQGFAYQYTTTSTFNLTTVQNPSYSKDTRTIFSIDFFLSNEYLMDYTNHRIGLKNN